MVIGNSSIVLHHNLCSDHDKLVGGWNSIKVLGLLEELLGIRWEMA